ncbi:MarR family winged helix-turn-helix transcriptional regulator [Rarobacter faecitabidus]|uniref:DNA-binding MarR family transcriptional regulator n=1 Tax=Rarobacter faecitabidus TaxID=13243 RepID=A0A542ZDU2_RARFA|nr:MarR family transcriptional regulator [Rarobacter faecitabidus]TQL58515.1 DNA-binding MarR family transcriptional regulator [Rarobacter faecitabidus]
MSPELTDQHTTLLRALAVVIRRGRRISQRSLSGLDTRLDPSTYSLLSFLHRTPGATLSGLAGAQGVSKGTMSRQVARLESFGLISRDADENDSRSVCLTLTEAGLGLVQEMKTRQIASLRVALDDWDEADLAQFTLLLKRFADDLERADPDPCGPRAVSN